MKPTNPEDMFGLLDKMRMNLTQLQAQVTDMKNMLAATELPKPDTITCPDCTLELSGPKTLAVHRYQLHDGPEPEHWKEPA